MMITQPICCTLLRRKYVSLVNKMKNRVYINYTLLLHIYIFRMLFIKEKQLEYREVVNC